MFIDLSQNSRHKTTIGVYSPRARPERTVSTRVTWEEVAACAGGELPMRFRSDEVLERVDRIGDLFAETATLMQRLPLSAPRSTLPAGGDR